MEHFLTTPTASKLWKDFVNFASMTVEGANLHHIIMMWWYNQAPSKIKEIYKLIPALIILNLWRRRNTRTHEGKISMHSMIDQVVQNIKYMMKRKYPGTKIAGE